LTSGQQDELRELLRLAVEEYRFNVTLAWDRTKHYTTVTVTLLAGSLGLLKLEPPRPEVAALGFACGVLVSLFATSVVRKGHEYYRNARRVKTDVETLLGRDRFPHPSGQGVVDLRLSVTKGMAEEASSMTAMPARGIRGGSISRYTVAMFEMFAVLHFGGLVIAGANFLGR